VPVKQSLVSSSYCGDGSNLVRRRANDDARVTDSPYSFNLSTTAAVLGGEGNPQTLDAYHADSVLYQLRVPFRITSKAGLKRASQTQEDSFLNCRRFFIE